MDTYKKLLEYEEMLKDGVISEAEFQKLKNFLYSSKMAELGIQNEAEFEDYLKKDVFKEAILMLENNTAASYREAIFWLEKLGDWGNAASVIEQCREELPKLEEVEATLNLEKHREDLYETALNKLQNKTSSSYKEAISALEELGNWKDSESILEQSKKELVEIEKQEAARELELEKKKKKKKRTAIIIGCAVVALIIAIAVISDSMKPDLIKFSNTNAQTIHSISFKLPTEWEQVSNTNNGDFQYYKLEKNGKIVAAMVVEYKGETDLEGDAYYNADADEHYSYKQALSDVENAAGLYNQITVGTSVFEVCCYGDEKKVKHIGEFIDSTINTFDKDNYKNPRITTDVTFEYTGDKSDGATINEGDISDVVEVISTGSAVGTRTPEFTLKEKGITFEAGKTSTITIIVDGKEYTKEVDCSTKLEEEESSGSHRHRSGSGTTASSSGEWNFDGYDGN